MALSGSYSTTFAVGGALSLILEWTATQNVNANTSTVTAKVYLKGNYSYSTLYAPVVNSGSITIDGTKYGFSATSSITGTQKKLLGTASKTIGHNADGTRSFSVSSTYYVNVTFSGQFIGNKTASGSASLNTIPRASKLSISPSSGTLGSTNVSINVSKASSSFTHEVYWSWNAAPNFIAGQWGYVLGDGRTSVTSGTWTPPLSIASLNPNSTSNWFYIYIDTFNGNTRISREFKQFSFSIPSTVVPVINSQTLSEATTEPNIATKIGGYVQGYSKLKVVSSASGAYDSSIRGYSTKVGGTAYVGSTITSSVLSTAGTVAVETAVTDSRGRTAKKSQNITVLAYTVPQASMKVYRTNANKVPEDEGEYATIKIEGAITALNNKNDKTIKLEYSELGANQWSEIPATLSTYDFNIEVLSPVLGVDKAYDFRLTVTDTFNTVIKETVLPTPFTTMDFKSGGKGVAFGEVSTKDGLYVGSKMPLNIIAPTSTESDGGFFRLRRSDNTLLGFACTGDNGTGLKVHMYDGEAWSGYISIDEDGTIRQNGEALKPQLVPVLNVTSIDSSPYPRETNVFTLGDPNKITNIHLLWRMYNDATTPTGYLKYSKLSTINFRVIKDSLPLFLDQILIYNIETTGYTSKLTAKQIELYVESGVLKMRGTDKNAQGGQKWWGLNKITVETV